MSFFQNPPCMTSCLVLTVIFMRVVLGDPFSNSATLTSCASCCRKWWKPFSRLGKGYNERHYHYVSFYVSDLNQDSCSIVADVGVHRQGTTSVPRYIIRVLDQLGTGRVDNPFTCTYSELLWVMTCVKASNGARKGPEHGARNSHFEILTKSAWAFLRGPQDLRRREWLTDRDGCGGQLVVSGSPWPPQSRLSVWNLNETDVMLFSTCQRIYPRAQGALRS